MPAHYEDVLADIRARDERDSTVPSRRCARAGCDAARHQRPRHRPVNRRSGPPRGSETGERLSAGAAGFRRTLQMPDVTASSSSRKPVPRKVRRSFAAHRHIRCAANPCPKSRPLAKRPCGTIPRRPSSRTKRPISKNGSHSASSRASSTSCSTTMAARDNVARSAKAVDRRWDRANCSTGRSTGRAGHKPRHSSMPSSRLRGRTRWAAFIDVDEFLFTPTGRAAAEVLRQ